MIVAEVPPPVDELPREGSHVEVVVVFAPRPALLAVGPLGPHHRHVEIITLRDEHAPGGQQAVTRVDERGDVLLVGWQASPQVGDDHVGPLARLQAGGELLNELYPSAKAVRAGESRAAWMAGRRLDRVDASRAELAGEQGVDAEARADVEHCATGANRPSQRLGVRIHANPIGDHPAVGIKAIRHDACRSPSRRKLVHCFVARLRIRAAPPATRSATRPYSTSCGDATA
jgi:hypothetical protein